MLIDRVAGAAVPGADGLVDLALADGAITGTPSGPADGGTTLPVHGRVVVPAFVDAHVHLDKAFLLHAAEAAAEGPLTPDLATALGSVAALRTTTPHEATKRWALQALDALRRNGTTAARAHVELDPAVGLSMVALHHELVEACAWHLDLQGVAFPQAGLEHPAMPGLLAAALGEGLPVVGGCPYLDDDPVAHLDLVFALAERYQVPVDLHLDFGDDPTQSLIGLVVERTVAHGMQGHVAIGHVTTLAAMAAHARACALAQLADAGVALVVLPTTDLHLAGKGGTGRRAIAPVCEADAAGVLVAIGNNNIANPFSPFGDASVQHAAWLAGLVGATTTPQARATLLAAITDHPARLLGLPARHLGDGAPADLVVLDAADPDVAVAQLPGVVATVHGGRLVHVLRGPEPVAP